VRRRATPRVQQDHARAGQQKRSSRGKGVPARGLDSTRTCPHDWRHLVLQETRLLFLHLQQCERCSAGRLVRALACGLANRWYSGALRRVKRCDTVRPGPSGTGLLDFGLAVALRSGPAGQRYPLRNARTSWIGERGVGRQPHMFPLDDSKAPFVALEGPPRLAKCKPTVPCRPPRPCAQPAHGEGARPGLGARRAVFGARGAAAATCKLQFFIKGALPHAARLRAPCS